MLRTKRGRCEAPGLRPVKGSPLSPEEPLLSLRLWVSCTQWLAHMLNSLVRVSRRVERATDLLATEMRPVTTRSLAIRDRSNTRPRRSQKPGACRSEDPQTSPEPLVRQERFVAWSGSEVQAPTRPTKEPGHCWSRTPRPPRRHPEPPPPTSRAPPFTTIQFHVLLNSLFKVLFNFPSRYLFAIGLGIIFSLTWSLPRTLSCTPKQLDSREKPAQRASGLTGLSPSTGHGPSQGALERTGSQRWGSPEHHIPRDRDGRQFDAGLCPFHSPLLRASRLFSFPPLINMLKFGG